MLNLQQRVYILFFLLRVGLVASPGYVQPDEFFQGPEIAVRDRQILLLLFLLFFSLPYFYATCAVHAVLSRSFILQELFYEHMQLHTKAVRTHDPPHFYYIYYFF